MFDRLWMVPHQEAVDDLGPIRFSEEMPPNYKVWRLGVAMAVMSVFGLFWVFAHAESPPPPPPGASEHQALVIQRKHTSNFIVGLIFTAIAVTGFVGISVEFWWTALVGSYSVHAKGAMAVIRGKETRIDYDDVDELTFRARSLRVNGQHRGDALWVTFGSSQPGTVPVRLLHTRDGRTAEAFPNGLVPPEIMAACNHVSARIAARIGTALASGKSYAFTKSIWLTPNGVFFEGRFREKLVRWDEIAQVVTASGYCFLYKRGQKKPVARWPYQTKNAMPVCMVINHAAKPKQTVTHVRR